MVYTITGAGVYIKHIFRHARKAGDLSGWHVAKHDSEAFTQNDFYVKRGAVMDAAKGEGLKGFISPESCSLSQSVRATMI